MLNQVHASRIKFAGEMPTDLVTSSSKPKILGFTTMPTTITQPIGISTETTLLRISSWKLGRMVRFCIIYAPTADSLIDNAYNITAGSITDVSIFPGYGNY